MGAHGKKNHVVSIIANDKDIHVTDMQTMGLTPLLVFESESLAHF